MNIVADAVFRPERDRADPASTAHCTKARASTPLRLDVANQVDLDALRAAILGGVDPLDRPIVWRVLLHVVGPHPSEWATELYTNRTSYAHLVRELSPFYDTNLDDNLNVITRQRNLAKADETLLHEIEKDVARTQVDLPFFSVHGMARDWMVRILYLFAKTHAEIGYCQGMHEVLAPVLFVFGTDKDALWSLHAEADAFAGFETLMQLLAPLHLASKQQPPRTGAQVQMARLHTLLRQHDASLWLHLNSLGVLPDYYSFRWYITLLSHEFEMDETLRLWDALLADSKRFALLHYVCVALILSHRRALIDRHADFGTCLTALQSKPTTNVQALLDKAFQLRDVDRATDLTRTRPPGARGPQTTQHG
ncbi:hypothetical protein DYB32_006858 [Aphanomyces invadans]|uniref:Rab-GAP TBC domain-containing protein n=1 Tax=Aphanomyces invadans TaxID=157072 RepID=A0A3R6VIU8_9STRA|nr:hypothetical protein DYB32_006858 [Aphanomyces invadans]